MTPETAWRISSSGSRKHPQRKREVTFALGIVSTGEASGWLDHTIKHSGPRPPWVAALVARGRPFSRVFIVLHSLRWWRDRRRLTT